MFKRAILNGIRRSQCAGEDEGAAEEPGQSLEAELALSGVAYAAWLPAQLSNSPNSWEFVQSVASMDPSPQPPHPPPLPGFTQHPSLEVYVP